MPAGPLSTHLKRAADGIVVLVTVPAEKLGDAFPTAGTATATGLTIATGTPTGTGCLFAITGGTSGTVYTGTATITLSDGRTVVELFEVEVLDESFATDATVEIDDFPPDICFTSRKAAESFLGKFKVALRLDRNGSTGIDPAERKIINQGAYIATDWVKMHCSAYTDEQLAQNWGVYNWATIYFARWLCLREGNPVPPGIQEMYVEVREHLREVRSGVVQLAAIKVELDPEPSWSNLRIDPTYAIAQLRVQRTTSDKSTAGFKRKRDTAELLYHEFDL